MFASGDGKHAFSSDPSRADTSRTAGRSYHQYAALFLIWLSWLTSLSEPLRRADLLNAINKLAGERGTQKHLHLLRRPAAIAQAYP
jgi:hypothetical protein